MPTISPITRSVAGATTEEMFRQPRQSIKASTGMNLPPPQEAAAPAQAPQTGQPGITEATDPKAVTLSPQLTALARKQQALQREIQAQRDKENAWATEKANYIPKSSFKAKLQENAAEALQELGLDYNELTDLLLNQQQSQDPVKKLEAELNKFKSDQEQNVSKQYEATVNSYRKEIESLVAADENYITVKEEGAQDAVLQHILETFKDGGEVLTVEQASKDIEEFLVDEAMKRANYTKVKAKLAPPTEKQTEKTLPPPRSGARTLTEQVSAPPTRTHNQFQHLSMKERIAQSIARTQK